MRFRLNNQGTREPDDQAPLSVLVDGTTMIGTLRVEGGIVIAGRLDGTVCATGRVVVAPTGVVEGHVFSGESIVSGMVSGDLLAAERAEVRAGGRVLGNISAPRLVVEDGAEFNGHLRMEATDVEAVPAQPPADGAATDRLLKSA